MNSLAVSLDFPVDVPIEINQEEIQDTLKELFVLHLFKTGKVSIGKAAEMLDVNKHEMLDIIYSAGIPYYDYDKNELEIEFEAVKKLGSEEQSC